MADNDKKRLKPIGQKTIVDQIINTIIDSIVRGDYKAGTKLPSEYELIEEMQVSRNSLREAMKILSTMGIVEIKEGMVHMYAPRLTLLYLTGWYTA